MTKLRNEELNWPKRQQNQISNTLLWLERLNYEPFCDMRPSAHSHPQSSQALSIFWIKVTNPVLLAILQSLPIHLNFWNTKCVITLLKILPFLSTVYEFKSSASPSPATTFQHCASTTLIYLWPEAPSDSYLSVFILIIWYYFISPATGKMPGHMVT